MIRNPPKHIETTISIVYYSIMSILIVVLLLLAIV